MHRLIRAGGSLLVLAGLALLVYVGISYAQERSATTNPSSRSQQAAGRQLASRLSHHQIVAAPRARGPLPAGEPALRMVIPKIDLDAPVVQTPPVSGVWAVADWSIGHLSTTPGPGAPGNGAYAAHDDIKGELFKRLGELSPGDRVLVYTRHTVYRYAVARRVIVDPSDISVLGATRVPTVTLVTCLPYWVDTQRLIVQAVLKSSARV